VLAQQDADLEQATVASAVLQRTVSSQPPERSQPDAGLRRRWRLPVDSRVDHQVTAHSPRLRPAHRDGRSMPHRRPNS
jgi:hypothetical protein